MRMISYLWIDSLCIKQNNEKDWERESSQMGNIYKHSQCNIGATGATDEHGGLGLNRGSPKLEVVSLQLHIDGIIATFYAISIDLWSRLSREALNNRAWVLQERRLAPSMIHFGTDNIFWECHAFNACQSFPNGIPTDFYPGTLRCYELCPEAPSLEHFDRSEPLFDANDPRIRALEGWNDLCIEYMSCDITRPGDKLVALSGLAKEYQALIQAKYLAGLWDYNLVPQLLWKVNTRVKTSLCRPPEYRAPSWSWASVEDEIEFAMSCNLRGLLVDVIEVKVQPAGADPTGAVISGHLNLTTCLFLLKVKSPEEGEYYDLEGEQCDVTITLDTCATLEDLAKSLLFCIRVQHSTEFVTDEAETSNIAGLILEEFKAHCYRRVGIFREEVEEDDPLAFRVPPCWQQNIEIV